MKALYAGSFDPITYGHLDVLSAAADLFDEVVLGFAVNSSKTRRTNVDKVIANVERCIFKPNIKIVKIDGLVAEYCKDNQISYLIRGLRNANDYLYEENIAEINKEINPGLNTIYIRATNKALSSSMVWELYENGMDISKYIPYDIQEVISCQKFL